MEGNEWAQSLIKAFFGVQQGYHDFYKMWNQSGIGALVYDLKKII